MLRLSLLKTLTGATTKEVFGIVKTIANADPRKNYRLMEASKHPLSYSVTINSINIDPIFSCEIVADIAKVIESGHRLACCMTSENYEMSYYRSTKHFYWWCKTDQERALDLLELILENKSMTKEDIAYICDIAMSVMQ